MAQRKAPETKPVLDESSTVDGEAPRLAALEPTHFDNVIRFIKMSRLERVQVLREATQTRLEDLGVKVNPKKAVGKMPKSGSDHVDIRALVDWAARICEGDKEAIKQLVAIDATCAARGA